MQLTEFEKSLVVTLCGMLFTAATVVYVVGKKDGKSEANEASSQARDDEIMRRLDTIDSRLRDIDSRASTTAVLAAELRTTIVGQSGNNGINATVKNIDERLRNIENRKNG